MNVDYFRYLELAGNFLNFRLCEIQLGTQCLLGEHGPLTVSALTQQQASYFSLQYHCMIKHMGQENVANDRQYGMS